MSAINRFRTAISDDLKARDKDRRLEAWICFLFALVVAPAAYITGTRHWPFAAVGFVFTAVWLITTLSHHARQRETLLVGGGRKLGGGPTVTRNHGARASGRLGAS